MKRKQKKVQLFFRICFLNKILRNLLKRFLAFSFKIYYIRIIYYFWNRKETYMDQYKILIVEDDKEIAAGVAIYRVFDTLLRRK